MSATNSHVERRTRRWLTVAVAAVALIGAGCGEDDSSDGAARDGAATAEPLKIGISLPLTGDFSHPAEAARQGYEVWADAVNAQGGVLGRQVELVIKDDASDQNIVISDYNALISRDDADLLLGTFTSLLNLPASAVAERRRLLYVTPAGGAPALFERDFRYLFFAGQATVDHQGDLFAEHILGLPADERPRTVAYPSQDTPFTLPIVESLKGKLEAAGIETVYEDLYPQGTSNFDAIASAVKAAEPDLIVHGAGFEDGVGFIRALGKVRFQPRYLFQTEAPALGAQFAESVGVENTEAIFYPVSYSARADTPGNDDFVARFEETHGGPPPQDAANAYAAGQVLQAAVEGVGEVPDRDQIALADWLRENEVQTIIGPLSWAESGAPRGEFRIGQWQDGEAEIVLPEEAATSATIADRPR